MNSAVSKLFGGILNVFHIAVIVACFVLFNEVTNKQDLFIVLGVAVVYVMLVGVVCTLLAIRENLDALVAIQSPKRDPKPVEARRQEPAVMKGFF